MASGPLSTDQIDEFIDRGWTLLRHAFPSTVAQAVRRNLSGRIGVDLERPEQWSEPKVWLQTVMKEAPYTDALTERFHSAVDQLVGAGRWNMTQAMGWWPITFPGFDDPPYGDDWHIDGGWLATTSTRLNRRCSICSVFDGGALWGPGVVEVVAEEGDVVLAHPLLFHSSNPNRGTCPRVMAQPAFSMTGPMSTEGDDLYPVEIPLARARR
jgi:hypothetical protein